MVIENVFITETWEFDGSVCCISAMHQKISVDSCPASSYKLASIPQTKIIL